MIGTLINTGAIVADGLCGHLFGRALKERHQETLTMLATEIKPVITDATHGMTLSAVSLPYYRFIMPYGVKKFKRFAMEVWGVDADGKSDEQVAKEGLDAMEDWMKKLGVAMKLSEIGATEDMIDGIADGTIILEGGYKVLTKDDVKAILRESL